MENLLERSAYIQLLDGSVVLLEESSKALILDTLREMSTNALRCLGFAYKDDLADFATYDGEDHPAHRLLLDPSNYSSIESDLIFVGLVGLRVRNILCYILYSLSFFHAIYRILIFLWNSDHDRILLERRCTRPLKIVELPAFV